ncbi:MAG: hypothetical protein AAF587_40505 [Bacteroidota bacterium]
MNRSTPILQFLQVLLRAILSVGFSQFHFHYHPPALWRHRTEIVLSTDFHDSREDVERSLQQKKAPSPYFFLLLTHPESLLHCVEQLIRQKVQQTTHTFLTLIQPILREQLFLQSRSRLSPTLPCIQMR